MNKVRSHRGVVPYHLLVAVFGITLATFLLGTGVSFKGFHNLTEQANKWDTASLATATVVANSSSNMLAELKSSIQASVLASHFLIQCHEDPHNEGKKICLPYYTFDNDNGNGGGHRKNQIYHRLALVNKYLEELKNTNGLVRKTLDYGLLNTNSLHTKADYTLINSNFLTAKLNPRDSKYASTLLKGNEFREIRAEALANKLLRSGQMYEVLDQYGSTSPGGQVSFIKISRTLFNSMLGGGEVARKYNNVIAGREYILGLEIVEDGINLRNLPNGIKLDLETVDKSKKTKSLAKVATAQLSLEKTTVPVQPPPPRPPKFCEGTGRQVVLTGGCIDNPGAPSCPCYCDNKEAGDDDCIICGTGCETTKAPSGGSNGGTDKDEEEDLESNILINIKSIPAPGQVETLFDPNKEINRNNPIVTRNSDGEAFSGIFPEDGDLKVVIGNGYNGCGGEEIADEGKEIASFGNDSGAEVDLLNSPAGWIAISKTTGAFAMGGVHIPEGSIVFARGDDKHTLTSQSTKKKDFSTINIYSADGGEELLELDAKDLDKNTWDLLNDFFYAENNRKIECLDAEGNPTGKYLGKAHTEFGLSELFPGKSLEEAVKSFAEIKRQRSDDRQRDILINGNDKKQKWEHNSYTGLKGQRDYTGPSLNVNLLKVVGEELEIDNLQEKYDVALEKYKEELGREILRPSQVKEFEAKFYGETAMQEGGQEAVNTVNKLISNPEINELTSYSDPIKECIANALADLAADFEDTRFKRDDVRKKIQGFKEGSPDYDRLQGIKSSYNTKLEEIRDELEALNADFDKYRQGKGTKFSHPSAQACLN